MRLSWFFNQRGLWVSLLAILFIMMLTPAFAADAGDDTAGLAGVANKVTQGVGTIVSAISAAAYLAGIGFGLGSILKFKQHKDNPTQIPVGTPIAMLFIAVALVFLPSIIKMTGQTLFGEEGHAGGAKGSGINIIDETSGT